MATVGRVKAGRLVTNRRQMAIRFADQGAPPAGTIVEHQVILKRLGHVYFGKMGKSINVARFCKLLEENPTDQLMLVRGAGAGRTSRRAHYCTVDAVLGDLPAAELDAVPFYYRNLAHRVGTWFRLTEIREATTLEVEQTVVTSSGRPLQNVLSHATQNVFYVEREG